MVEIRHGTDPRVAVNVNAINLNTTHRTSDGTDHSDVVSNNTHRALVNEHIDWTSATANFSTSGTVATGVLTVTGTGSYTGDVTFGGGFKAITSTTGTLGIHNKPASGISIIDLFPDPGDGSSNALMRVFRSTNTTGGVSMQFFKGDNTSTVRHLISTTGTSIFNSNGDDLDVIFEGVNDTNLLKTDAGLNSVAMGVSSPLGKLHVDQNSTTGAKPVLYLDQADISEEMMEFNTTIGTGNAIEAIAAKTLTQTHFIKITIPGGLTRYIPCGTIA